jgi:hypothetical protein
MSIQESEKASIFHASASAAHETNFAHLALSAEANRSTSGLAKNSHI